MRTLANQIIEFYKRAIAENDQISDEDYEEAFKLVMDNTTDVVRSISHFLKKYHHNIKQNKQDLRELISKTYTYFSGGSGLALAKWIKSLNEIDPEFYTSARNYVADLAVIGSMDMYEVVTLEHQDIFTAVEMRSILNRVLKSLQQEDRPEFSQSAQDMQTLSTSKYLNPKLIKRLLREYVPWLFAVEYAESKYDDKIIPYTTDDEPQSQRQQKFDQHFLNKEHYTQDDAVYLMDFLSDHAISYGQFRRVVDATNTVGQNTLRRGLYSSQSQLDDLEHPHWFILDETLQPISADYKPLNPNSQALMGRTTKGTGLDEQFTWIKAFTEMGIVPYGDTFRMEEDIKDGH